MKGKFYGTAVRPAKMYGSERWYIDKKKNKNENDRYTNARLDVGCD